VKEDQPASPASRLRAELEAIRSGTAFSLNDVPCQVGLAVFCNGDAEQVRTRICEVLVIADRLALQEEDNVLEWERQLPRWFCEACSPPQTQEEAEADLKQFHAMSWEEQYAYTATVRWSLPNWQHWMTADHRQWWVRNLIVQIEDLVEAVLDSDEFSPPLGAFRWLCRAAGATEIL